jgi:hypothetical protein
LWRPSRRTRAQTAGETKLGVTVVERDDIINGWSVKRQLLGQDVYNDKDEMIGKIEDIIIGRQSRQLVRDRQCGRVPRHRHA